MKKYLQYASVFTAVCFTLSGLLIQQKNPSVKAEDAPKIVVIGDSISSGEGLAEGEKSYVDWVDTYTDAEISNFAQDNYTTGDILESLENPEIQQALSEADFIFVTAGMEDVMNPFFGKAQEYMEQFGFEQFSDVFYAELADYGISSEDELFVYSNQLASAVRSNQQTATENFNAIVENLSQYQQAKIIYQTVYNATDTIENYSSLSAKRQLAYNSVCNPVNSVLNNCFNNYLYELEENGTCLVADVYTAFKGYAYQYTNLNFLDANPTAEGHALIADLMIEKAGLEKHDPTETFPLGDLNNDQKVNAVDAALVLQAAANIGAGLPNGLLSEAEFSADVNQDKKINASDAAFILQYAAENGAGNFQDSFEKYMQTQ